MSGISYLLISLMSFSEVQYSTIFTDKFERWSPDGKLFNAICLDSNGKFKKYKEYELLRDGQKHSLFNSDGEKLININPDDCFLEQNETSQVSRMEFAAELQAAKCKYGKFKYLDGDFRVLSKRKTHTWVKQLTTGKVWALSNKYCEFVVVLATHESIMNQAKVDSAAAKRIDEQYEKQRLRDEARLKPKSFVDAILLKAKP